MKLIFRYIRLLFFKIGYIKEGDRYYYWFLPTDKIIDAEKNKDNICDIVQRDTKYSVKFKNLDILRRGFFESKENAQAFADWENKRFKTLQYYKGAT